MHPRPRATTHARPRARGPRRIVDVCRKGDGDDADGMAYNAAGRKAGMGGLVEMEGLGVQMELVEAVGD
jgi:hypothetical protein